MDEIWFEFIVNKLNIDDDFVINLSIEKTEIKLVGFIRVRSKNKVFNLIKGLVVSVGDRIKKIQS